MENILTNILTNPHYFSYLSTFLSKENIQNIIQITGTIQKRALYPSLFHGLHHSEKVMLNAYLIGKHLQLNPTDFQILIDAALYHDIGRSDESEDTVHGYSSTLKLEKVITSDIYQDINNFNLLKAICDGHARDDRFCRQTFDNYELPEALYERYEKLYKALKDADALDRTRFGKTSKAVLKSSFLRYDFSKKLIDFSYFMNDAYKWYISETLYSKLDKEYNQGPDTILCYHGIGFNLFQLQSILQYGILSEYAMRRMKMPHLRNFNGNNNEMWISAVLYDQKGKAYQQFVQNGISLIGLVPNYHEGVKSKAEAKSTGLPHRTDLYDDEVFIFDQIPRDKISTLVIPKSCINLPLNTLYYLNGSLNYDIVLSKIEYYRKHLLEECDYDADVTVISKILFDMQTSVLNFENLSSYEQQVNYKEFFQKMDSFGNQINQQLQIWMASGFQKKYKMSHIPTLLDCLKRMLTGLNYQVIDKDGEIQIILPMLEIEKDVKKV